MARRGEIKRTGHGWYRARQAAVADATIAELMALAGHSTPGAAMPYQHAASDRTQDLAARLSELAGQGSSPGVRRARLTGSPSRLTMASARRSHLQDVASGDVFVPFSDSQSPADVQSISWIRTVQPTGPDAMSQSVLPPAYVADLVDRVGPGPIGWAIEVAAGMAESILETIPELGVDGVVQEMRKGCEVVAVPVVRRFC